MYPLDVGMYNNEVWYSKEEPQCCDIIHRLEPSDIFHNSNNNIAPYDTLTDMVTVKVERVPDNRYCIHGDDEDYVVRITGLYGIERFSPIPSNTTFLRTVIINHDNDVEYLSEGTYLDQDIYEFLVYGNNDNNYTDKHHDHVNKVYFFDDFYYGNEVKEYGINVNGDYPFITVMSYLDGSPDWIMGVSTMEICNDNGWRNNHKHIAYVYDAGMNDANAFYAEPIECIYQEPVRRMYGNENFYGTNEGIDCLLPEIAIIEVNQRSKNNERNAASSNFAGSLILLLSILSLMLI